MALPVSTYGETVADNTLKSNGSPETAVWSVPIGDITAANFDATELATSALSAAVNAIIIGNLQETRVMATIIDYSPAPATSALAQRENKWLVRYHGASLNKKFRVSLPTADLTLLGSTHSEFLNIASGVGATFKAAFEAIVVSPDDAGEAVIVDSVQFVGRNT